MWNKIILVIIPYLPVDTVTWKQAMKTWHSDEPQSWSKGWRQRKGGRNKAKGKEHGKRRGEKAFHLSTVMSL